MLPQLLASPTDKTFQRLTHRKKCYIRIDIGPQQTSSFETKRCSELINYVTSGYTDGYLILPSLFCFLNYICTKLSRMIRNLQFMVAFHGPNLF